MTRNKYDIETLFKALADRTRLRLISLMGDSEVCVCFFRRDSENQSAEDFSSPRVSATCRNCCRPTRGQVDALSLDRTAGRTRDSHLSGSASVIVRASGISA